MISSMLSPATTASQSNPASRQCNIFTMDAIVADGDSVDGPVTTSGDSFDRVVAARVQSLLLPPALPSIEGWSVAALYEPAGEAVLVGGDFYDWFILPDGTAVLMFGDVEGKGPAAGAAGMSLRKALKGAAHALGDPFAAVPVAERAVAAELASTFASLCLLRLTPSSGHVAVMLAGHPPPWVRHRGVLAPLPAPANRLIGIGVGPDRWDCYDMEMAAGDLIFVHTDGLSEAMLADGSQYGESRLPGFLAALPEQLPAFEVVLQADAELRRVVGSPGDDVIIGALTFATAAPPPGQVSTSGEIRSLRLAARSGSSRIARQVARDVCDDWQVPAEPSTAIEVIVSELVTNAVLHARSALELRLMRLAGHVRIEVSDGSTRVPPMRTAPPPPTVEHGRGLLVVRAAADDVGADVYDHGKTMWATVGVEEPARPG